MPIYLQAYLNIAHDRLEEQKKEAGRITNVDLQRKVVAPKRQHISPNMLTISPFDFQVASIFYYLCVVTLQYVAPLIMCLYFALMYKTLGGYNWSDLFHPILRNETTIVQMSTAPIIDSIYTESIGDHASNFDEENILTAASDLKTSIQGLKAVSISISWLFIELASHKCNRIFRYSQRKCIGVFSVLPRGGHCSCGLPPHR